MSHPKNKGERNKSRRKRISRTKSIYFWKFGNPSFAAKGQPRYINYELRKRTYWFEDIEKDKTDFFNWVFMEGPYMNEPVYIKIRSHSKHCKYRKKMPTRRDRHLEKEEISLNFTSD